MRSLRAHTGIMLIFMRFPMLGFALELLGFVQLFGNVMPFVFQSTVAFVRYTFAVAMGTPQQ